MSGRRTKNARRGYVLVFIAMMMLAFFGMAALVIDMGMVRLTQRQMQSATDSAALEGLRFRDGIPAYMLASPWFQQLVSQHVPQVEAAPQSAYAPYDAAWGNYIGSVNSNLDAIRRVLASQMVSNIFDDDLNPNDNDSSGSVGSPGQPGYNKQPGNWGAGGVVKFQGFVGSDPALAAGQTIQIPQQRTYNPGQQNTGDTNPYDALWPNLLGTSAPYQQQPYGDMVSGTYGDPAQAQAYDNAYGSWTVYPWEETAKGTGGSYDRRDFAPALAPVGNEPSFLVRMRRLNPNDFQNQIDSQSGVSTSGPGLPFLFARGTAMLPTTSTSYQPRVDGLTVRATGIGNAAPVVTVGPVAADIPDGESTVSIDGLASYALHQAFWNQGFVDPANVTSPPFTAIQTEAIEATDTTINLVAIADHSGNSVLPPIWQSPQGTANPNANPTGLNIVIEQEIMQVTEYDSSQPAQWTVQRSNPVKHAAGTAPNGQVFLPLQLDALGNLVDVPITTVPAPAGVSSLTKITNTGHAFSTSSNSQFAMVVSNIAGTTTTVATVLSTSLPTGVGTPSSPAIVAPPWTFGFTPPTSAPILANSQVDVICPTSAIGQDDTQLTVAMPVGYLPDHTDPGHVTSQMYLALVYDPTNPSSLEFVRIRSQATQTSTNSSQTLLCKAMGQFNLCVWEIDRGLLGTQQVGHSGQNTVIRPIAGVAIGDPQAMTTIGDPLVFPTTSPTTLSASVTGTISPLFEDLQSSVPSGATLPALTTARVVGFGRVPLLASSTTSNGYTSEIIPSAVVSNSTASFSATFAADLVLAAEDSPSSDIATPGDLWQALMILTKGSDPQDKFRLYPLNQALAPSLMSTVVPPPQQ